jgi:hypothetical protein
VGNRADFDSAVWFHGFKSGFTLWATVPSLILLVWVTRLLWFCGPQCRDWFWSCGPPGFYGSVGHSAESDSARVDHLASVVLWATLPSLILPFWATWLLWFCGPLCRVWFCSCGSPGFYGSVGHSAESDFACVDHLASVVMWATVPSMILLVWVTRLLWFSGPQYRIWFCSCGPPGFCGSVAHSTESDSARVDHLASVVLWATVPNLILLVWTTWLLWFCGPQCRIWFCSRGPPGFCGSMGQRRTKPWIRKYHVSLPVRVYLFDIN